MDFEEFLKDSSDIHEGDNDYPNYDENTEIENQNSDLIELLEEQKELNAKTNKTLDSLVDSIEKLSGSIKEINLNSPMNNSTADGSYTFDLSEHQTFKGKLLAEEKLRDISVGIYERNISFSGSNIPMAQDIYYAQKLGLKLRHIEAELNGGRLVFDGDKFRSSAGSMKFSRINIGLSEMFKGFIRKGSSESFFLPSITGVGTLQLKDTVKYLHMVKCHNPRKFILENGVYAASAGDFKFGIHADTKVGSVVLSGKHILQTSVEGKGILILELPVPPNELVVLRVTPDRPVRINEQEVIYREGNVKRNKRLASGIFGSLATGTGFVEEYTGNGLVVLAPSLNLADIISNDLKDELEESIEKNGGNMSLFGGLKDKILNKNSGEEYIE